MEKFKEVERRKDILEEDIFALINHYNRQYGKVITSISPEYQNDIPMWPRKLEKIKVTQIENLNTEPKT